MSERLFSRRPRTTTVYDLRVTVERIEGRTVCGLAVGCPDPDERLVMRIERIRRRRIPTERLT